MDDFTIRLYLFAGAIAITGLAILGAEITGRIFVKKYMADKQGFKTPKTQEH